MKKFTRISISTVILLSILTFGLNLPISYAAMWEKPVITTEDKSIKVSIDKTSVTNGSITITIDTSKFKNGNNVIYSEDLHKEIKGSIAKFTVQKNGYYVFDVSDVNADYHYGTDFIRTEKSCSVEIHNIDNKKPTIKSYIFMDELGYRRIRIETQDDMGIRRITQPDGEKIDCTREDNTADAIDVYYDIPRNGKYTFVVEDYVGNKSTRTITITDYKTIPLKVNKVTNKTLYITGKTLPKGKVKANNGYNVLGTATADSKGNFKLKLKTVQKVGAKFYVSAIDINKKYVTKFVEVKVVRK